MTDITRARRTHDELLLLLTQRLRRPLQILLDFSAVLVRECRCSLSRLDLLLQIRLVALKLPSAVGCLLCPAESGSGKSERQ